MPYASLYQFGTSMYAVEVSFDRPFDQQLFYNMVTKLELPWVRFLERNGIDVSYQTDVDTDRAPDRCCITAWCSQSATTSTGRSESATPSTGHWRCRRT
jgi:hypothetical protein